MLIKTPKFWLKKNLIAYFLLPLSAVYFLLTKLVILFSKSKKVSKKIICVGNINLGGSGKTPVAVMIGKILKDENINFVYLNKGYGAQEKHFGFVDNKNLFSTKIGDEALILAEISKTFIASNRLKGIENIAKEKDVELIILDDGFQDCSIKKDFSILVIDSAIKFGNGFYFPAGPLREGIAGGIKRSDLVIVIGEIDQNLQNILKKKNVIQAKIIPNNISSFVGKKMIAFCGIAYPQKFFTLLKNEGVELIDTIEFADHYVYCESDLKKLLELSKSLDANLICTKKDWVKFSSNFRSQISYLDIDLEVKNKEFLKQKLLQIIKNSH